MVQYILCGFVTEATEVLSRSLRGRSEFFWGLEVMQWDGSCVAVAFLFGLHQVVWEGNPAREAVFLGIWAQTKPAAAVETRQHFGGSPPAAGCRTSFCGVELEKKLKIRGSVIVKTQVSLGFRAGYGPLNCEFGQWPAEGVVSHVETLNFSVLRCSGYGPQNCHQAQAQ